MNNVIEGKLIYNRNEGDVWTDKACNVIEGKLLKSDFTIPYENEHTKENNPDYYIIGKSPDNQYYVINDRDFGGNFELCSNHRRLKDIPHRTALRFIRKELELWSQEYNIEYYEPLDDIFEFTGLVEPKSSEKLEKKLTDYEMLKIGGKQFEFTDDWVWGPNKHFLELSGTIGGNKKQVRVYRDGTVDEM